MNEEWRPVGGYEGLYEVSDQGRVRRIAPGRGVRVGRILKPQRHTHDYRTVTLTDDGAQTQFLVHRLVAAAFLPRPLPGFDHVNHKDGHKDHNAIGNLEYTTRSGNVQHAIKNGLAKVGDRHFRSVLTAAQVREIRAAWSQRDCSQSELASRYSVSRGAIVGIIYGKNWKQLREESVSYGPR